MFSIIISLLWKIYDIIFVEYLEDVMKKKLFICLLCVISLIFVVGCGIGKKALTQKEFSKIAEDNKLTVIDVVDQFADHPEIKSASLAASPDGWQIEYYILDNAKNAKKMFEKNKLDFENLSSKGSNNTMIEIGNYAKYTADSDSYFMVAARVNNTFLFVKVPIQYKKAANSVIKDMGY